MLAQTRTKRAVLKHGWIGQAEIEKKLEEQGSPFLDTGTHRTAFIWNMPARQDKGIALIRLEQFRAAALPLGGFCEEIQFSEADHRLIEIVNDPREKHDHPLFTLAEGEEGWYSRVLGLWMYMDAGSLKFRYRYYYASIAALPEIRTHGLPRLVTAPA